MKQIERSAVDDVVISGRLAEGQPLFVFVTLAEPNLSFSLVRVFSGVDSDAKQLAIRLRQGLIAEVVDKFRRSEVAILEHSTCGDHVVFEDPEIAVVGAAGRAR